MSDLTVTQAITFTCGVIMCIIGIATFISGLLTRARKDGQLETKVDTVLKNIDEINQNLKEHSSGQQDLSLEVESQKEKIVTLFTKYGELKEEVDTFRSEINEMYKKGQ